jgi:hypothetical protein
VIRATAPQLPRPQVRCASLVRIGATQPACAGSFRHTNRFWRVVDVRQPTVIGEVIPWTYV